MLAVTSAAQCTIRLFSAFATTASPFCPSAPLKGWRRGRTTSGAVESVYEWRMRRKRSSRLGALWKVTVRFTGSALGAKPCVYNSATFHGCVRLSFSMTAEDGLIASMSSLHLQHTVPYHHHHQQLHHHQPTQQQTVPQMSQFGVAPSANTAAAPALQQPGAWYFDFGGSVGSRGSDGSSGGSDNGDGLQDFSDSDSFNLQNLGVASHHALLNNQRNVTESVDVPSSEHVAEIVGRQGCKIKALRAKTNTYIKTPVRGEDPTFVVTGRAEDVMEAKREIECAAEHFTQIRASRRHSQGGAPAPGHVTAYVRVPLRVVGLVVGPKGATIKRIQQDTHTYIITPSREREPVFEVTGLPQNVASARREIEQHIYQRTGSMPITDQNTPISQYDLQNAALAAVAVAQQPSQPRPAYGSLATGTHQLRQQMEQGRVYVDTYSDFSSSLLYNTVMAPKKTSQQTYSSGGSPPPGSTGSASESLYNSSSERYAGGWSTTNIDCWSKASFNNDFTCGFTSANSQNSHDEGIGGSPTNFSANEDPTTYSRLMEQISAIWKSPDKENGPTEVAPIATA
uniref:RING-type domain-containing protein n=1 Tax=Steinernema glaseri TaxID=37863 RepID=A0A1I7YN26_9BILA